jgi:DNA-binding transcriptional LysR family regulator
MKPKGKTRADARAPARRARSSQGALRETLVDELGALALFSHVVEQRSFTGAARRSGTSTSAASKRIAGLEKRLGVRLIERTTRSAVATEAGLVFYERCQRVLAEAAAAEEAVSAYRGELVGTLRVSAPVTFGQMHIVPLVTAFLARHAELKLQLSLNDQSVDLIASGVDVAIRSGRLSDSSLMSRKLAADRRVICATPAYLADHGTPKHPHDLDEHRCLRHPLMAPSGAWTFITPEGPLTVPISGPLEVDHVGSLRDVALASLGLVFLPAYAVAADLRARRLISVLGEFMPDAAPFRALWAAGKQPSLRVTAFVDFLAAELPKRV